MDHRLDQLERAVADLSRALDETRRRVADLEARAPAYAQDATPAVLPAAHLVSAGTGPMLPLLGRTFVVLAGGYLLRALTDGGTFPRPIGTAFGLAYAIAWFVAAWRADDTRRPANAAFHTAAAVLIAFPLAWESVARVHLMSQASGAVAVAGVTGAGLAVAWKRRAQVLAWVVTSAGLVSALALMTAAAAQGPLASSIDRSVVPATLYLAFLGVVTLWVAYQLDWTWLRWPPAIAVDASVLAMTWSAAGAWQREQAGTVMLVQLVLFGGYLVSFTTRTLWRSRRVVPFEVVQTLALLVVCFGGAVYLTLATGSNAIALGAASVVFGAGSYAAAFAFIDWRRGHWTNFVCYASLGVVFTVAGTALAVSQPLQPVVWAVLAAVTAWGGRRYGSITLSSHATIYVVAASVACGLLAYATRALTASAAVAWEPLLPAAVPALAAALVSCAVPQSGANESWGRSSRVPKLVSVVVLLWTLGGVACGVAVSMFAGAPGTAAVDAAAVATVRTAVLAAAVLILAWLGGGPLLEGRWLSSAVLVAGGVKLLVEDFPGGRPSTLFLSLAMYGGVLIVGPRLRARAAGRQPPSSRVQPV